MKRKTIAVVLILIGVIAVPLALSSCGSVSPAQVTAVASTLQAKPPVQRTAVAQTLEALPTLSTDQVQARNATITAAIGTPVRPGAPPPDGLYSATQRPLAAPVIVDFFASAPSDAATQQGVAFYLNYDVQNATQVEIYGNTMDNPQSGQWPVYQPVPGTGWVLWAANDTVWVQQYLEVGPDQDVASTLASVTVNSRTVTLSFLDPQYVDGDVVTVLVNGQPVLTNYTLDGRSVSVPVTLNDGGNTVEIQAVSEGVTPPLVAQVSISNVTSGSAVQNTSGLTAGGTASFTITAP